MVNRTIDIKELMNDRSLRHDYIMENINNKLKWLEDNTDHNIIYIALQGSQNYNMDIYSDEYMSDIDVKAICLPSLDDIIKGSKMVSHTYIMDDNSHVDVKDIRLYKELWKKQNPQFLEILFTEFYICKNKCFKQIFDIADRIAAADKYRLLSCIKGMQMEKFKALKHPYPSIKDKIDKYGYDPKQLHHILRLMFFASDIMEKKLPFGKALKPFFIQECLIFKVEIFEMDVVDKMANDLVKALGQFSDKYKKDNESIIDTECYEILDNIVYEIIKDQIVNQINDK